MRQQRTLRQVIGCAGVGLHSGARVALTLRPAAEGSGIRFRRVDRPGSPAIAAVPGNALAVDGVVCLSGAAGHSVRMVEHLLAALAVCEIDNALVEISGAELPAMDGSALPFVRLMECAGTVEQAQDADRLEVLRPIAAASAIGFARLEPADEAGLSLETGQAPGPSLLAVALCAEASRRELVGAREGSLEGDGAGRHALLDALGTLALVPARIAARYREHNADAELRCALLRALVAEAGNWRLTGTSRHALVPPACRPLRRAG